MRKYSKIVDFQPVMFADGSVAIANLQRFTVKDGERGDEVYFKPFCDSEAGHIKISERITADMSGKELAELKNEIITAFAPKEITPEARAALYDTLFALRMLKADRVRGIKDAKR